MKTPSITSQLAIGAALVGACGSLKAANLLMNSDFENPLFAPEVAGDGNWSAFSGGPAFPDVSTVAPFAGAQHLAGTINGLNDTFSGIQQNFPTLEGEEYTFSLYARGDGPVDLGVEFRIEWLDATGAFVGGQFDNNVAIQDSLTDTYQLFSQTRTAPAGTASGRVVIALQTFTGGTDIGTVFIDNAEVEGIPEPSSLLLSSIAALGLLRRRR